MTHFEHLGPALHLLRVRNGWSLGTAAERIGLPQQQVSRYEGTTLPQTETLQQLLTGLGCNLVDLHEALTFVRSLGIARLPRGRGKAQEQWRKAARVVWPRAVKPAVGVEVPLQRIGPALMHLRLVRGLSAIELGQRSGLDNRYLSRLEQSSNLQLRTVSKVLETLECDLRDLQVALALVEVPASVFGVSEPPALADISADPDTWRKAAGQVRRALKADTGPRSETTLLRLALLSLGQPQQPAWREAELAEKLDIVAAELRA